MKTVPSNKGAFTGATGRKIGKFEIVDSGTIFLDEIGDISPRMQASLLRVLQNGEKTIDIRGKLGSGSLKNILSEFEREIISEALHKYGGNVSVAADKLHIGKTALYDKMRRV